MTHYIGQWTSYNQALTFLVRDPKHRARAKDIAMSDGRLFINRRESGRRLTREEIKEKEDAILKEIILSTVDLR
ncbi:unnamed protein product [Protopolystoma xenopodis]|uniref:Uncharacterized protein n=1 Tax=Protopolystoma xenopodis TaxID=117903 RepID=A0A3S5CGF7_9PLAT|nr:unnamed protein product [Protopolystoma xenopodis]